MTRSIDALSDLFEKMVQHGISLPLMLDGGVCCQADQPPPLL